MTKKGEDKRRCCSHNSAHDPTQSQISWDCEQEGLRNVRAERWEQWLRVGINRSGVLRADSSDRWGHRAFWLALRW